MVWCGVVWWGQGLHPVALYAWWHDAMCIKKNKCTLPHAHVVYQFRKKKWLPSIWIWMRAVTIDKKFISHQPFTEMQWECLQGGRVLSYQRGAMHVVAVAGDPLRHTSIQPLPFNKMGKLTSYFICCIALIIIMYTDNKQHGRLLIKLYTI